MNLCPAFWCSRCKIEHAGECPPAKVYPQGYVIEPRDDAVVATGFTSRLVNHWPPIGTTWRSDLQNHDGSITRSIWTYEVLSYNLYTGHVKVRAFDDHGKQRDDRDTPVSAWWATGMTFTNGSYRGQRMWMVDP